MKWQAITVLSSSRDGLTREEAAALVATLDGIALSMRSNPAPEAIKAARERFDSLARLRDQAPRRRVAGHS